MENLSAQKEYGWTGQAILALKWRADKVRKVGGRKNQGLFLDEVGGAKERSTRRFSCKINQDTRITPTFSLQRDRDSFSLRRDNPRGYLEGVKRGPVSVRTTRQERSLGIEGMVEGL